MNPVRGGVITTSFNEPRPLSLPPAQRNHPHGALDIAGGDGIIVAPASGTAQGFIIWRGVDPVSGVRAWGPSAKEKAEIHEFPWREYWQDIYGGIIALIEPSGRLHLLCHVWPARIFNPQLPPAHFPFRFAYYIEEAATTRWPCHLMMTEATQVREGQPLAPMGNAGYSTGKHLHWEIHHQSDRLDDYPLRINPVTYL